MADAFEHNNPDIARISFYSDGIAGGLSGWTILRPLQDDLRNNRIVSGVGTAVVHNGKDYVHMRWHRWCRSFWCPGL
jgi:hypothetical protein